MNDLELFCRQHSGRTLRKWTHYFEIYDRYFHRYRGASPVMIEIGVFKGGSLQMWKKYFGPGSRIIGIDIDPDCKMYEEDGIEIHIGSQDDPEFLTSILKSIPSPDIILDDGGHFVSQQIKCFEITFPFLKDGGIYLCEDVHTSYWYKYGGGRKRMGTFIEYMKDRIDDVNGWYWRNIKKNQQFIRDHVYAISFFDSVVGVEKRLIEPPIEEWFGDPLPAPPLHPQKWWKRILVSLLDKVNIVLQFFRLPSIFYGR